MYFIIIKLTVRAFIVFDFAVFAYYSLNTFNTAILALCIVYLAKVIISYANIGIFKLG